ncbi:hypothetical protein Q9Q94_14785 [Uliginosibacterium sp. 31-16]|uniref:hypothetical protein n=1 Tax=Uliginosibacterium sp. 31-16 TaxID=3068315 RepID=UPI00273E44C6|nr:hypothetical protein [Uliginosibacterium sp. 31-16]MDP5240809.1 hypothetical protein [Uliginosibacterium sp. 31-16]
MSIELSQDVIELLNDRDTIKVLASVDGNGVPHAVFKQSLHLGEDGRIHSLELIESSTTGRNLVGSIWFERKVTILLRGTDKRSVQIKGRVLKYHITGPLYLHHYNAVRERLGDVDLAGVWVIEPEQVIEQSFKDRRATEDAAHPSFIHLDRIAAH